MKLSLILLMAMAALSNQQRFYKPYGKYPILSKPHLQPYEQLWWQHYSNVFNKPPSPIKQYRPYHQANNNNYYYNSWENNEDQQHPEYPNYEPPSTHSKNYNRPNINPSQVYYGDDIEEDDDLGIPNYAAHHNPSYYKASPKFFVPLNSIPLVTNGLSAVGINSVSFGGLLSGLNNINNNNNNNNNRPTIQPWITLISYTTLPITLNTTCIPSSLFVDGTGSETCSRQKRQQDRAELLDDYSYLSPSQVRQNFEAVQPTALPFDGVNGRNNREANMKIMMVDPEDLLLSSKQEEGDMQKNLSPFFRSLVTVSVVTLFSNNPTGGTIVTFSTDNTDYKLICRPSDSPVCKN